MQKEAGKEDKKEEWRNEENEGKERENNKI